VGNGGFAALIGALHARNVMPGKGSPISILAGAPFRRRELDGSLANEQ
jgi:hypothetical protein